MIPLAALDTLIKLGVDRVLTSGSASNVLEVSPIIRQLIERANGRITIMAGGGISPNNIARILDETGLCDIHYHCI